VIPQFSKAQIARPVIYYAVFLFLGLMLTPSSLLAQSDIIAGLLDEEKPDKRLPYHRYVSEIEELLETDKDEKRLQFYRYMKDLRVKEKAMKRLQFNRYVERELALELAKKRKKIWSIRGSAAYGYDNNVALNARRNGDDFHEETFEGTLKLDHEGIPHLLGSGTFGTKADTEFRDYNDDDEYDFHHFRLSPYVKTTLFDSLRLELEYQLQAIRYIRNNQVNYLSHGAKAMITQPMGPSVAHRFYFLYRFKDYIDRHQKSAEDTNLPGDRKDIAYEPGYSLLLHPQEPTYLGMTGSWKFNESNDLYVDFNDYQSYKFSAYVYRKVNEGISWVGAGGYERKDYESRTYLGLNQAQEDDYFYLASYLYFAIDDKSQFFLTYLYGQNDSTNPAYEYSSSTMTLGFAVSL